MTLFRFYLRLMLSLIKLKQLVKNYIVLLYISFLDSFKQNTPALLKLVASTDFSFKFRFSEIQAKQANSHPIYIFCLTSVILLPNLPN